MATPKSKPKKQPKARARKPNLSWAAKSVNIAGSLSRIGRRPGRRRIIATVTKRYQCNIYDYAVSYIENNGTIPELDLFMELQKGDIIYSTRTIVGQTTRPAKRERYRNYKYLKSITRVIPKNNAFVFIERHKRFPEFYRFMAVGYYTIWVNIADQIMDFDMHEKENLILREKRAQQSESK